MTYQEKSRNIYNSSEWSFTVRPEFSDITPRVDMGREYKTTFPLVNFYNYGIIDGNVLIQDCTPELEPIQNTEVNNEIKKLLNSPESVSTFQVFDALSATVDLKRLLGKFFNNERVLFIFPGNGALSVKRYLQNSGIDLPNSIEIPVTRTQVAKGKFRITMEKITNEFPITPKEIVIVDDVVASGQTAREVASRMSQMFSRKIKFNLACWLMMDKAEYQPYFNAVYTPWVLKGNWVSRPPVNSLSCLLDKSGRYDWTKISYSNRYLGGTEALQNLQKIISSVKGEK